MEDDEKKEVSKFELDAKEIIGPNKRRVFILDINEQFKEAEHGKEKILNLLYDTYFNSKPNIVANKFNEEMLKLSRSIGEPIWLFCPCEQLDDSKIVEYTVEEKEHGDDLGTVKIISFSLFPNYIRNFVLKEFGYIKEDLKDYI